MRSIKEIKEQLTQATAQLATLESVASRLDVFEAAERAVVEASITASQDTARREIATLQDEMASGTATTIMAPVGDSAKAAHVKIVGDFPALRDTHVSMYAVYFDKPEDTEPTAVLTFKNRVSRVTRGGNGGGSRAITVDGTTYPSAAVANRAFFGEDATGANRASIEKKLTDAGYTIS